MEQEIEIHICARDSTFELLIKQKIDNIFFAGGISKEALEDFWAEEDLNTHERECMQNNLTLLGLYGSYGN